jgi:histidine ammonia-lyase
VKAITGTSLSVEEVVEIARRGGEVVLDPEARARMVESAALVETLASSDEPAYGISTGFGALATTFIPEERRVELQHSLVRSHAAGSGPEVEREVVRAMMLLRARTLAMGYSGARPEVADRLLAFLAEDLTPVVHEYGSLGASGDLAPLAHVALALIGEGRVEFGGEVMAAASALASLGLAPLTLRSKEGLALIKGTDGILGMLCLAIVDMASLLDLADIAAAMTTEALLGTDRPFRPELHALRPQPGQAVSAARMLSMLERSPIVASHRDDDPRVQDAYSVRCTPQVNGAARDTLGHVRRTAEAELVSAIDNPVIMPDGSVESVGNFHGAPLGFVADFAAIALAEVGAISERRMDRMLDPARSHGLPPFLTPEPGVRSGFMIAHYAAVSMAAENRRLAAPASVDSMPTSAMQEDHVSMAWGAARKLRTVIANTRRILATEVLIAAQALDLRAPLAPAARTGAVRDAVRRCVPFLDEDRVLADDIQAVERLAGDGSLVGASGLA